MSVRWVCEFRDPWTIVHPYYPHISSIQRRSDKLLERVVLRCSDHIVSVGEVLKEELIKLGGSLLQDKVSVIYNGYDKDDFTGNVVPVAKDNRCVITYVGTWGPGRSPEYFLEALAGLLRHSPDMKERLRINFIGEFKYSPDLEKRVRQYIEQASLSDVVSIIPWLPYKEALARLLASDILLLIERPESATNNNFWVVTSKIFLYLYAKKPILALLPSGGEAAKIIQEAGAGEIVSPTDVEAIASKIGDMYKRFEKGDLTSNPVGIEKFDQRIQTAMLAEIFDSLAPVQAAPKADVCPD
jgi:glycosyltransferase involved in cell wall biosynthesis